MVRSHVAAAKPRPAEPLWTAAESVKNRITAAFSVMTRSASSMVNVSMRPILAQLDAF